MISIDTLTRQTTDQAYTMVLDGDSIFECLEVVRRVPGKRAVCRGVWQEKPVYAKLFIGKHAARYAARDSRGVDLLMSAGIKTPELLAAETIADQSCYVLIFAAVEQAMNAEQLLAFSKPEERLQLAHAIVQEVAWHHNAGIYQADLYFKNFLVKDQRIWTIDGDAIRELPRFFGRWRSYHNLAVLLSKFDVLDMDVWLPELLATYQQVRDCGLRLNVAWTRKLVDSHRAKVVRGYANHKVFRQCTDVTAQYFSNRFVAITSQFSTDVLRQAVLYPDHLLDDPKSKRLKRGNTCTVSLARIGSQQVVVKRYNMKSLWHRIGRAFRVTRASQSWSSAHRLLMYGIKTPMPIALIEERALRLVRGKAYFLAAYVEAEDINEYFLRHGANPVTQPLVDRLALLFYKMNLLKISHGDFKSSNIKVLNNEPVLIDLDAVQEHRCRAWFERQHRKDLRRFMQNWQQMPAVAELFRDAFKRFYKDDAQHLLAGIVTNR